MRKSTYDAYAESNYLQISPYKLRKVADQVRDKNIEYALKLLKVLPQKGSRLIYKVLHSAMSNAVNNKSLNQDSLIIKSIIVNEGKRQKRFQPRARGRAFSIVKRTSNIKVGLILSTGDNNGTES